MESAANHGTKLANVWHATWALDWMIKGNVFLMMLYIILLWLNLKKMKITHFLIVNQWARILRLHLCLIALRMIKLGIVWNVLSDFIWWVEYVIEWVIYAESGVWRQVLAFPAMKTILYQVILVYILSK